MPWLIFEYALSPTLFHATDTHLTSFQGLSGLQEELGKSILLLEAIRPFVLCSGHSKCEDIETYHVDDFTNMTSLTDITVEPEESWPFLIWKITMDW